MATVAEMMVKIGADVSRFQRGMATARQETSAFRKSADQMSSVGSKLTRNVTLPIVALGAYSVKAFADAEQGMNVFQNVTGATGDQMKRASALAKQLGNDVKLPGVSAADAAQALVELGKGGMTAEQSMKAVKGALQLASAEGMDFAEAATIVSDTLHTFGMRADEARSAVDTLAKAANSSSASVEDVRQALQQAGAVAHQSGLSLEQTSIAIAELAQNGIKGSDAGTSLKTMLMRLTPSTKKAKTAMKELGVQVYDAQGNMRPFPDIVAQFGRSLDKLNPKQRQTALMTIFGSDAIRSANIILGQGEKAWDKQTKAYERSGGAASNAAARNKGLSGDIEAAKSAAETAALSFGAALAPAVSTVAGVVASAATKFSSLSSGVQSAIGTVLIFTALLGPMINMAAKLVTSILTLREAMVGLRATALVTSGALSAMSGIFAAFTVAALLIAFMSTRDRTDEMGEAFKRATDAINGLSGAMDKAKKADLTAKMAKEAVKGATLGVERATRSYNEAVKANGKNSLEAREAAAQLRQARLNLQDATIRNKDAQVADTKATKAARAEWATAKKGLGELIATGRRETETLRAGIQKTKESGRATRATYTATTIFKNRVQDFIGKARELAGTLDTNAKKLGGNATAAGRTAHKMADAARAAGNLAREIGRIPTKKEVNVYIRTHEISVANDHARHANTHAYGRAIGGPVHANHPYRVNEKGRGELFVPQTSGRILNDLQLSRLGRGGGGGRGDVYVSMPGAVLLGRDRSLVRDLARMIRQELRSMPEIRTS